MNTMTTTTASAVSRVLKSMNYEPKRGNDNIGFSVSNAGNGVILISHRGYDHGQLQSTILEELLAKGYEARQDAAWTDTRNGTTDKIRVQLVSVYGKVAA
jgi:hypothetical protein